MATRTGPWLLVALLGSTNAWAQGAPREPIERPASPAPASFPSGRVTGLVFGDYYSFPDHHDEKFDGQHGFWLRRVFLGYDHALSERMSGRVRLEVTSNGLFAGGALTTVLKDAWFTWRYKGRHQARLGVQPTLTFESEDAFWGLRHVEKVPTDLYLLDSSRDFAIQFTGPLGESGISYGAQLGNESGQASEADPFKIVRLLALYEGRSGLRVEGAFNYGRRPAGQHRKTAKGLVGFRKSAFRGSVEYLRQERQSGTAAPDTTIGIWSGFAWWEFAPKKAAAFARFDSVRAERGSGEIGLPGAETIAYLGLAGSSPFRGWIAGLDLTRGAFRLSPNVELFDYEDDALGKDVAARLTFLWTF